GRVTAIGAGPAPRVLCRVHDATQTVLEALRKERISNATRRDAADDTRACALERSAKQVNGEATLPAWAARRLIGKRIDRLEMPAVVDDRSAGRDRQRRVHEVPYRALNPGVVAAGVRARAFEEDSPRRDVGMHGRRAGWHAHWRPGAWLDA